MFSCCEDALLVSVKKLLANFMFSFGLAMGLAANCCQEEGGYGHVLIFLSWKKTTLKHKT